jgi:hypothetical protein
MQLPDLFPQNYYNEPKKALAPTVEITKGQLNRVTGWGWKCSCGDERLPSVVKRNTVLEDAMHHFTTKHGGQH